MGGSMLPPMKQNPYLSGLLVAAIVTLVAGVLAFVLGIIDQGLLGVGAQGIAPVLFPFGLLGLFLYWTACAIVWRPSDEPARKAQAFAGDSAE